MDLGEVEHASQPNGVSEKGREREVARDRATERGNY